MFRSIVIGGCNLPNQLAHDSLRNNHFFSTMPTTAFSPDKSSRLERRREAQLLALNHNGGDFSTQHVYPLLTENGQLYPGSLQLIFGAVSRKDGTTAR